MTDDNKPPTKHKKRDDWTVEETVEYQRSSRKPLTQEYKDYVRKVHEDAGLDVPAEITDAESTPIEEMTPDDHFKRIRAASGHAN
jgi:hypothetical protein